MEKSSFPRETKAIVVKYRWPEVNAISLHETIFERVGDFDDNSKITGEKSPTLKDRFRKPVEISEIFESKRFERQRGASLIFCDCQVAESQSDDERLWKIKRAEKVLETQSRDSLDSSTKYECAKDRGINKKKKKPVHGDLLKIAGNCIENSQFFDYFFDKNCTFFEKQYRNSRKCRT